MMRPLLAFLFLLSFGVCTSVIAGKSVEVDVNGMFCEMCAYGLSLSLNDLEGVKKAKVFYEEHRATVEMEDGKPIDLDLIKQAVVDSGFTPETIRVVD